jgi:hypothetical protein
MLLPFNVVPAGHGGVLGRTPSKTLLFGEIFEVLLMLRNFVNMRLTTCTAHSIHIDCRHVRLNVLLAG